MNHHFLSRLASAIALSIAATSANAALLTGDIAFTALNADEDGWSLVTFVDIDANTDIFFSDGLASSATAIGNTESSFSWNTGAATISAGTVVRFSAIDTTARAASIGSFSVVNSANLGLSATAETIYAFLGSTGIGGSVVTTMLTAASTEANNTSLTTVGLSAGANAIKLTSSTDYAGYTGARSGAAAFADYVTAVNNTANWAITVGGDGSAVVPDTTSFTTVPVPVPAALPLLVSGLAGLVGLGRRRRAGQLAAA